MESTRIRRKLELQAASKTRVAQEKEETEIWMLRCLEEWSEEDDKTLTEADLQHLRECGAI